MLYHLGHCTAVLFSSYGFNLPKILCLPDSFAEQVIFIDLSQTVQSTECFSGDLHSLRDYSGLVAVDAAICRRIIFLGFQLMFDEESLFEHFSLALTLLKTYSHFLAIRFKNQGLGLALHSQLIARSRR